MKSALVLIALFAFSALSANAFASEQGVDSNCYYNCMSYVANSTECTRRCDNARPKVAPQKNVYIFRYGNPSPYELCFRACMEQEDEYLTCSTGCSHLLWHRDW